MFTGIIEQTGTIESVSRSGSNTSFWVTSPLSAELKVDQSISHNGVCLTVEEIDGNRHRVTAISETLQKTNLGDWQQGHIINLERCLAMNGRLDGHIVQGHVDTVADCISAEALDGSWEYTFRFDPRFAELLIEKGSVSVNGTSLTCFNVTRDQFTVAIIPYTYEHTSIRQLQPGSRVNIEFDMVGKYVVRKMSLQQGA
jgi:riboflavin synthase